VCGSGLSCAQGVCNIGAGGGSSGTGGGSSGTGGGSSGTGGGSSGTGGGTVSGVDNELVSGTRLRAIYMLGADGSKIPWSYSGLSYNIFWDNQLNTYCTPNLYYPVYPSAYCFPVVFATAQAEYYSDPSCTLGNAGAATTLFNDIFVDAGLQSGTIYYYLPDAGLMTAMTNGTAYARRQLDGGCDPIGPRYTAGVPVPYTSLVQMSVVRD
jgi:hypothetical protein